MSGYITGTELIAFTNIDAIKAETAANLESNVILRAKKFIDKYCFIDFDDADTSTDFYAEIQLAQKLLAERIYIRNNQDVKSAHLIIGKGGSEKKGTDWSYSLGEIEELFTDEIRNLLDDKRDWTQEAALKDKPATGKILLRGDNLYERDPYQYEINRRM